MSGVVGAIAAVLLIVLVVVIVLIVLYLRRQKEEKSITSGTQEGQKMDYFLLHVYYYYKCVCMSYDIEYYYRQSHTKSVKALQSGIRTRIIIESTTGVA